MKKAPIDLLKSFLENGSFYNSAIELNSHLENFVSGEDTKKAIERLIAINKEWQDLFEPIDKLVRPLTPLGGSVAEKAFQILEKALNREPPLDARTFEDLVYGRPAVVVPSDYTPVKTETIQWLLGEEGDFTCPTSQYFRGKPAPYFWRSHLRNAMLSTPTPSAEYPDSAIFNRPELYKHIVNELTSRVPIVEQPDSAAPKITDAEINDITLDTLGKWPSFEAQSWACKVVHRVFAKQPTEQPQRITEQDVREIILEFTDSLAAYARVSQEVCSDFLRTAKGHALLAKLNEHREANEHNLNHIELIKAKKNSFMNCSLCGFSETEAVLVRSKLCSVFICKKCSCAVCYEFESAAKCEGKTNG